MPQRYNGGMPLFEYACRACGGHFEYLTRAGQSPACPSCRSEDLEKQLSVFAVSASSTAGASDAAYDTPAACGTCGDPRGPGSCSIN
jgi:putative FmdB family regulatory protein